MSLSTIWHKAYLESPTAYSFYSLKLNVRGRTLGSSLILLRFPPTRRKRLLSVVMQQHVSVVQ